MSAPIGSFMRAAESLEAVGAGFRGIAMNPIERKYFERDHAEALAIDRQMRALLPVLELTSQQVVDLNRFCECAEDDEGYDVPAERMRALRDAGLVEGGKFGRYATTEAGDAVRRRWWDAGEGKVAGGAR